MNKHLRAHTKSIVAKYFDPQYMDFQESVFMACPIPVEDIFNVVTHESRIAMTSYEDLHVSLASHGMRNPIIIMEHTHDNFKRACEGIIHSYVNTDDRMGKDWIALAGNSRLAFANTYKYDTIDCYIVPSFVYMHSIQLLQEGVVAHDTSAN